MSAQGLSPVVLGQRLSLSSIQGEQKYGIYGRGADVEVLTRADNIHVNALYFFSSFSISGASALTSNKKDHLY